MKNYVLVVSLFYFSSCLFSQDYEIQVYRSNTQPKGVTDFELHSNFTFDGSTKTTDGKVYTNNLFNQTIEITHGFTKHFESALYLFTSYGSNGRSGFAGVRIRNRIGYSQSAQLPVGLSISTEIGVEDPRYFGHTYGMEIKTIIDRTFDKLYLCINPTFELSTNKQFATFSTAVEPSFAVKYAFFKKAVFGFEYYTDFGTIRKLETFNNQGHILYPTADLEVMKNFTVNVGLGFKLNQSTDNLVFKLIVGVLF